MILIGYKMYFQQSWREKISEIILSFDLSKDKNTDAKIRDSCANFCIKINTF